jgi:hypothetical protein
MLVGVSSQRAIERLPWTWALGARRLADEPIQA